MLTLSASELGSRSVPQRGPRTLPWNGPAAGRDTEAADSAEALIHPKYRLPATCFAYVGDAGDQRVRDSDA